MIYAAKFRTSKMIGTQTHAALLDATDSAEAKTLVEQAAKAQGLSVIPSSVEVFEMTKKLVLFVKDGNVYAPPHLGM